MPEPNDNRYATMTCTCGDLHKGHICWLTNMGLLAEVAHLTTAPTVTCLKCGARANQPHNLCFPKGSNINGDTE